MIFNYFKIAWRNLIKYKFISGINLFGLTVGLTCCLLILTFILNELSYDKYNKDANRIYRVTRSFNNPETGAASLNLGTVAPPFGPLLQNDFKEIEDMTRLIDLSPAPVRYEDKMFNEQHIYCADDHAFNFFKIDMLKGDLGLQTVAQNHDAFEGRNQRARSIQHIVKSHRAGVAGNARREVKTPDRCLIHKCKHDRDVRPKLVALAQGIFKRKAAEGNDDANGSFAIFFCNKTPQSLLVVWTAELAGSDIFQK